MEKSRCFITVITPCGDFSVEIFSKADDESKQSSTSLIEAFSRADSITGAIDPAVDSLIRIWVIGNLSDIASSVSFKPSAIKLFSLLRPFLSASDATNFTNGLLRLVIISLLNISTSLSNI